jgi:hypothetical protein
VSQIVLGDDGKYSALHVLPLFLRNKREADPKSLVAIGGFASFGSSHISSKGHLTAHVNGDETCGQKPVPETRFI